MTWTNDNGKGKKDMEKKEKKTGPVTPAYTRKAIANYQSKFDRIPVNLPLGSKQWIREKTGMSGNALLKKLFMEYRQQIDENGSGGG